MHRRQSVDKPGILSPIGPFLTPSPSPSIQSASPRLQPSPSQSPFQQDVLLVTNNTITNTTQEQDRKAATPGRRPSIHQQLNNSPNAGTVLYRPSPTQSPAGGQTIVGAAGYEFNTTLIGSNNISLHKKNNKRGAQQSVHNHQQHGYASTTASSPKAPSKKATSMATLASMAGSPIASPSPIGSPTNSTTTLRPPTPQPATIFHQSQSPFPHMMNAGNQLVQIIQGPPQIMTAGNQSQQQRSQITVPTIQQTYHQQQFVAQTTTTTTTSSTKLHGNKLPQQILPKPATSLAGPYSGANQCAGSVIAQSTNSKIGHSSKTHSVHQTAQILTNPVTTTQHQQQQQIITTQHQQPTQQTGSIILPTNLNQPLLLNQMPVIVQQNTPQGVQLILRPPTPQLTAPGLVIHNTRPQLQQQQPQQLLRILNTNGTMQLAAPTFLVSSQANLIQQNLQTIKTQTATPLTTIQTLTAQQPQLAAAINSQLLGRGMAQIQNLQLNGNLTHIQMPNGLNGQFMAQLPAQFQQTLAGFNQNINFNQLSQTNFQQLAAAAAAATFQSPPPQQQQPEMVMTGPNIQFTTQPQQQQSIPMNVSMTPSSITPSPVLIPSVTPEPIRTTTTPITLPPNTVVIQDNKPPSAHQIGTAAVHVSPIQQSPIHQPVGFDGHQSHKGSSTTGVEPMAVIQKTPKKPKKPKAKKVAPPPAPPPQSSGKLDLANVMKLCGIMEDDDFMDEDENGTYFSSNPPPPIVQSDDHQQPVIDGSMETGTNETVTTSPSNQLIGPSSSSPMGNDIMVTIPYSHSSDSVPFTFTIPAQQQHQVVSDTKTTSVNKLISTTVATSPANATLSDIKSPDPQFMIKIDNSTGLMDPVPYTISIPSSSIDSKGMIGPSSTQPVISTHQTVSHPVPPVTSVTVGQMSSNMCVPTFVNTVLNSQVTPTLQSQINEIQNQLMGVVPVSNSTPQPTTSMHQPINKPIKQKRQSKKNKKIDTIPTPVGHVPSQIGNIQISQIDSSKNVVPVVSKPVTIENKIQITPIIDTKINQSFTNQQSMLSGGIQPLNQSTTCSTFESMPSTISTAAPSNLSGHQHMMSMQMMQQSLQQQQQQPIIPQLNGSLSLSLAEDGRLILRHNPNAQQDAQSQMILQALLSGALCNVTLINEPIDSMKITAQQQQTVMPSVAQQVVVSSAIQKVNNVVTTATVGQPKSNALVTTATSKNVMPSTSHFVQPQTSVATSSANSTIVRPPNPVYEQSFSMQPPPSTTQSVFHHQQHTSTTSSHQMNPQPSKEQTSNQSTSTVNPNAPKFVELPKIAPNQQLFSLNTLTNQITQLSPGLTTAALGPMERLLIVPTGINAQQLAKCLSAGQIHFNNIGQATQANEPVARLGQNQPPMQSQSKLQQQQAMKTVPSDVKVMAKVQPVMEPMKSVRKGKPRKPKADTNVPKNVKNNFNTKPMPSQIHEARDSIQGNEANKPKPNTLVTNTSMHSSSAQLNVQQPSGNVPKQQANIPPTQQTLCPPQQNVQVVRPSIIPAQHQQSTGQMSYNKNMMTPHQRLPDVQQQDRQRFGNPQPIQHSPVLTQSTTVTPKPPQNPPVTITNTIPTSPAVPSPHQLNPQLSSNSSTSNLPQSQLPPLVSVNQLPVPRVQTIQLTPQKQQLLKTVQMHIQHLSGRLQNKSLLANIIIPTEFDPHNPDHNKPMPSFNNINAMNDHDIHQALQQLFIEQQKILASGKIIPTIPAGQHFSTVPSAEPTINNAYNTGPSMANNNYPSTQPTQPQMVRPKVTSGDVSGTALNTAIVQPINSQPTGNIGPDVQKQFTVHNSITITHQNHVHQQQLPSPIPKSQSMISTTQPLQSSQLPNYQNQLNHYPLESNFNLPTTSNVNVGPLLPMRPMTPPKPKVARHCLFERQLSVDQDSCRNPDYRNPFHSKEDAVKRLIRYHCMYTDDDDDGLSDEEELFQRSANNFQDQFRGMKNKYQLLLLKESMRHVSTSEIMMLNRMFVSDIQNEILEMHSASKIESISETSADEINNESSNQSNGNDSRFVVCKNETGDIKLNPDDDESFPELSHPNTKSEYNNYGYNLEDENKMYGIHREKEISSVKNEIKLEPDYPPQSVESYTSSIQSPPPSVKSAQSQYDQISSVGSSTSNRTFNDEHNRPLSISTRLNHIKSMDERPSPSISNSSVKNEIDNFDIESEITPSFIMKKCDPSASQSNNDGRIESDLHIHRNQFSHLPNNYNDFSNLPKSSTFDNSENIQNASSIVNKNKRDDDASKDHYDDWLCIQKELSLMTEKRSDPKLPADLFNHTHSPKFNAVENQLHDLFVNHLSTIPTKRDQSSPLSELLNHVNHHHNNIGDGHHNHHHQHSLKNVIDGRLDDMFGDHSNDKTNDLVETRLDELFHDNSPSETSQQSHHPPPNSRLHPSNMISAHSIQQQQQQQQEAFLMMHQEQQARLHGNTGHHLSSTNNKRHWDSNDDQIIDENSSPSPSSIFAAHSSKRSCVVPNYMDDSGNRWMMDCHQPQTNYDLPDFLSGGNGPGDDGSGSTGSGGTDCPKQQWNGDLIPSQSAAHHPHLDGLSSKLKLNFRPNNIKPHHLNTELLTMGDQQELSSHSLNLNLQHHQLGQHHQPGTGGDFDGIGSTDTLQTITNTSNNSIVSNFDDDINRHVQNAIDSILNLQNSDSDSLHFSLDHSMGSFLADDSHLDGDVDGGNSSGPTIISSSIKSQLHSNSMVNELNHLINHHQVMQSNLHHSMSLKRRHRTDMERDGSNNSDITDCMIGGVTNSMIGSHSSHHHHQLHHHPMMIDSPPTLHNHHHHHHHLPIEQSSVSTGGHHTESTSSTMITHDYEGLMSGIDDAVKSIITS